MVKVEVKIRKGTRSNTLPEMATKISVDEDAAGITSLVPGVKNLRLWNGLEFDWRFQVFLQSVEYKVIPTDYADFESLAWPCMIARWHHGRHNACTCHFFAVCLTVFPFRISTLEPSPSDATKKVYEIRAYDFGIQLPPGSLILSPELVQCQPIFPRASSHHPIPKTPCSPLSGVFGCVYVPDNLLCSETLSNRLLQAPILMVTAYFGLSAVLASVSRNRPGVKKCICF